MEEEVSDIIVAYDWDTRRKAVKKRRKDRRGLTVRHARRGTADVDAGRRKALLVLKRRNRFFFSSRLRSLSVSIRISSVRFAEAIGQKPTPPQS